MAALSKAVTMQGGASMHPAVKSVFQWFASMDPAFIEEWARILKNSDQANPAVKVCTEALSSLTQDKPVEAIDLMFLAWTIRNGRPGMLKLEFEVPEGLAKNLEELADVHCNGNASQFVCDLLEREVNPAAWKQKQLDKAKKSQV